MLRSTASLLLVLMAVSGSNAFASSHDEIPTAVYSLTDVEWVLGVWVHPGGAKIACESWNRASENTFEGRGFQVTDGDTVTTETLRLVKMGEGVYFISMVTHNLRPVSFKLVQLDGTFAVFENLEHDFPQRIVYSLEGDQLTGRIEGEKDGKTRGVDFPFVRARVR